MQYLPVFAKLIDRDCLVVGGGHVAERRVRQLLGAGGRVSVIAPELTRSLQALASEGGIDHEARTYTGQPLDRYWLVVAATDEDALNRTVADAAAAAKRLCNVVDQPELCSFIMPAIIERGPVTVAVSSSGTSPELARWVKGLIETILPSRVGALAALVGQWRERVSQTIPDIDQRRRFWQSVVTSDVAQHALAGRSEASELALDRALEAWHSSDTKAEQIGEAYIIGAGPGDAELITLRGRRLLAQADAVLYDRLVHPDVLAYARRDAELICVGKMPGKPSIEQVQINRLLTRLVSSGKRVCRLKGGDPMVFGRVGEELAALSKAGLPFQIVPGVSAVEGCAAYAGIPLTLRGASQAVLIATGHTKDHVAADLSSFRPGQTLALYMAVAHVEQVATHLFDTGHPAGTPAVVVENGTTDSQRVIRATLGSLAAAASHYEIRSPALILIGETARLAERYAWFNPRIVKLDGDAHEDFAQVS